MRYDKYTGDTDAVTKINHIPYQTIVYNEMACLLLN